MTTGKTVALTGRTFVGKGMSLLWNMLSRWVITFLPRSKRLLISWLQSPFAVILEPPKIKSATVSTVSPSICHEMMGHECLSPRVCLECNPEIPVAPGQEHWLLDTSLDEVYWPCSHSRAIPSFPSQLEWKIGLAWANTRGPHGLKHAMLLCPLQSARGCSNSWSQ